MVSRHSTDAQFKSTGLSGTLDPVFASKSGIEDSVLQPYEGIISDWPASVQGSMPGPTEPCETALYHAYSIGDHGRSADNQNNRNNNCFSSSLNDFVCKHDSTTMMDSTSTASSSALPNQIRFIFSNPSIPPMDVCSTHTLDAYGNCSAPSLEGANFFAFDRKVLASASGPASALSPPDSTNFNSTASSTFYSPHSPSSFHRPTRILVDCVDGVDGDVYLPSSVAHSPVSQASLSHVRSTKAHPVSLSPFPVNHHHHSQQHPHPHHHQPFNFEHPEQQQRNNDDGHLTTMTAMDTQRRGRYLANTCSTESLEEPDLRTHQQQQQQTHSLQPPTVEASSCTSSVTSEPINAPKASVSLPGFTSPESAFYQYQNRMEGQLCQICGELAAGFHHGAYVCEACKKFFMRQSLSNGKSTTVCPSGGNCVIAKTSRGRCQQCRYKKCLELGMSLREFESQADIDISNIPCRVCGGRSSGFHFGALTCEGCKGFFRRTEETASRLVCVGGKDNCSITPRSRNACKACRFRRCLRAGMSKKGSRIGRQPNAVKFHCAIEIRQLQASGPLALQPPSSSSSQGSKPDTEGSPSLACETAANRRPSNATNRSSVSLGRLCGITEDGSRGDDLVEGGTPIPTPPDVSNNNNNKAGDAAAVATIYEFPVSAPASSECKETLAAVRSHQSRRKPSEVGLTYSSADADSSETPLAEGLAWFSFGIRTATEFLRLPNTYFKSRFEMSTIQPEHVNDNRSIWNHLMNHFHMHSQQIVQFAKLIPGFNQLELTARGALVREGMYASMLLLLARDYEPATGKCNYFDFSVEERDVILRFFPPFSRIKDHLSITGRLYQELALTLPEFTLVCAIEILKNFAILSGASCTHARRFFLLAKHSLVATMQNQPSLREPIEKRCAHLESFSQVLHDLSLEHRDLLFALKTSRQDLHFPELFVEMFQLSVTPETHSPSAVTSVDTVAIGSITGMPQTPKTEAAAPFVASWTTSALVPCASTREPVGGGEENLHWMHPRTWPTPVSSNALGTSSSHAFSSSSLHASEESPQVPPPASGVDELDGSRFYL
uniref:Uncharacterized protein n=1 Tax=Schistocephalus solidus TaxID=70667 RepID=A0A0X3NNT8_SCHSO